MLGKFWKSLCTLIGTNRARAHHSYRRTFIGETLEQREMLSANQITYQPAQSAIVIEGTSGVDVVNVWVDTSNIVHVSMQNAFGMQTPTFGGVPISQIRFTGGDGDDNFNNTSAISTFALGEGGQDSLTGGTGDDYLDGGADNDFLYGNAGNDTLDGGDGQDQLYGQDGNDLLYGSAGQDLLEGSTGDDTIYGGVDSDTLNGGDGDDRLYGEAGGDLLYGFSGNDSLDGGADNDFLYGGLGDDTLDSGDGKDQLYGEDGNDLLNGGAGEDWLQGDAGNDTIFGGANSDTLDGGDGDDKLYGEAGGDTLFGMAGNDILDGGIDNDFLFGNIGDDTLEGGDGYDQLFGEDGNDVLRGGAGQDLLRGGVGDDGLDGGEDADSLYGEAGGDTLYGMGGNDVLDGGTDNDFVYGGLGDDSLEGGDGHDRLYSEDGNDLLKGGAGQDYLEGGLGNDTIYGGVDGDTLEGNDGIDSLYGEDGDDLIYGGAGNDNLIGGIGNDWIYGSYDDDFLDGGDGHDRLYGEWGNDQLRGGTGQDFLSGGTGNDGILGGNDDDTLDGGDGDDNLGGEDGDDILLGGTGTDYLTGAGGNDFLQGGAGDDTLDGDDGNDRLFGDDGNDLIRGGIGDDILQGGSGNDVLYGGAGRDSLSGNADDDTLFGEADKDTLSGGTGNDTLDGGDGNDSLSGNEGDDVLFGYDGDDILVGGDGNDRLYGRLGNDSLYGGAGNDLLEGLDGDDNLLGEEGDDYLDAGIGNDVLVGGTGNDQLYAGTDRDLTIGGAGADSISGDDGEDIVIGGSTTYDTNVAKLRAIDAVWSANASYSLRVAQLEDELYSNYLKSFETVYDDSIADTLVGGNQQDWFIVTGYLATYRPTDVPPYVPQDSDGMGHHATIVTNVLPPLEGFAFVDSIDKTSDRKADETVQTLLPQADTPSLQREHLALFQLVRYSQVTNYAVASGDWSNPSTWKNGVVPPSGARVLIPIGVNVRVDGVIPARIDTIRVDGNLTFNTSINTELRADTVIVSGTGYFEMGTETNPIAAGKAARLLITDNGAIDRTKDPMAIGRGLISHGKVSIYGQTMTSSATLTIPAVAGAGTLTLKSVPIGWKTGDSIVLASTTESTLQNETFHIAAILGSTIFLDRPLSYNHLAPSLNFDVYVANTTRNAVIESESTAIDRRGHVMFMHERDVTIGYAGFYKLGRTDKSVPINDSALDADWSLKAGTGTNPRARYSVHFHRNGLTNDGNPSTVVGSAVVDSPGWGFVNHSSYVDFVGNVAFDVNGAAFATEVGDEIGGFYNNIAIGATGTGTSEETNGRDPIQDFGFQGDGFWFQSAGVSVVGNIAAGNQFSGFAYYNHGLREGGVAKQFLSANLVDPSIARGAAMIDVNLVPIREFRNNVSYANYIGLLDRYNLQGSTAAGSTAHSFIENSTFWNNNTGIFMPYAENTTFRNLTIVNGLSQDLKEGIYGNTETRTMTFENLNISGYRVGIDVPRRGNNVVTGGTYNNFRDIVVTSAVIDDRNVLITNVPATIKVGAVANTVQWGPPSTVFFVHDVIVLNYGSYQNQRLYYEEQKADYVPFPTPRPGMPAQYIGLTNQQLWDQFGLALGGEIVPANTSTAPNIIGLIAPRLLGSGSAADDEQSSSGV